MAKKYKVSLNKVTDPSLLVLENKSTYIANTTLEDAGVYADYMVSMMTPVMGRSGCLINVTGYDVVSEMSGSADVGVAGSTLDSIYGGDIYTHTITTLDDGSDDSSEEVEIAAPDEAPAADEPITVTAAAEPEADGEETAADDDAAAAGFDYGTPTYKGKRVAAKGDLAAMSLKASGSAEGFSTVTLNTTSVGKDVIGGEYELNFYDDKLDYFDELPLSSLPGIGGFILTSGSATISVSASGGITANSSGVGGSVIGYKNASLKATAVSGNVLGGSMYAYSRTVYDDGALDRLYFSLELRSGGAFSADNSASAQAVTGYSAVTLANGSTVATAIGGKLDVNGSLSKYTIPSVHIMDDDEPAATVEVVGYPGDSGGYTYTYLSADGSLASTGRATVNNAAAGTLIGYGTVAATAATVNNAVAGSKNFDLSVSLRDGGLNYVNLDYAGKASGKFTANIVSGLANVEGYSTVNLNAASGGANVVGGALNASVWGGRGYGGGCTLNAECSGKASGSLSATASALGVTGGFGKAGFYGGATADYAIGGAVNADLYMNVEEKSASDDGEEAELKVGRSLPVDVVYPIVFSNRLEVGLKSSGSAEVNASTVGKAVGFGKLTLAADASVDYAVGGDLTVKARPILSGDHGTLNFDRGDAEVTAAGTLKLTGSAITAAAVGWKSVTASGAAVGSLVGGNVNVDFSATVPVDVSALNPLSPLTIIPQLVNYVAANADFSLKSGGVSSVGKATIGNASSVDGVFGYLNVTASYSTIGVAMGGSFSVIPTAGGEEAEESVKGTTVSGYSFVSGEAAGSLKAVYSKVTDVVGYRKVEFKGGEASGVALAADDDGGVSGGVSGSSLKLVGTRLDSARISGFSTTTVDNVSGVAASFKGSDLDDKLNVKRGVMVLDGELDMGDGYDVITIDRNASLATSAEALRGVEAIRGKGSLLVRAGAIDAAAEVAAGVNLIELDAAAFDSSHSTAENAAEAAAVNTGALCLFNTTEWFRFSLADGQDFSLGGLDNIHYALYSVDEEDNLTRCYDYTLAAGDYRLELTLADPNKLYGVYEFAVSSLEA